MSITKFIPLNIAILTISDTRKYENDHSGQSLATLAIKAGHLILERFIIKDEIKAIQNKISEWVANPKIQIILSTGGTGLAPRDITIEALAPFWKKEIPGFGELFRMLSYESIGSATIQSRASAGITDNNTLIFALPGSTGACKDAWNKILGTQLDNRTKPCNFIKVVDHMKQD